MPSHRRERIQGVLRWPSRAAIGLIAVYQFLFSPLKFFLFGGTGSCRFYPTCSQYARESLHRHGLLIGLGLSIWRLLKCHPFHPGGFDPVPERAGCSRNHGPARPGSATPAREARRRPTPVTGRRTASTGH